MKILFVSYDGYIVDIAWQSKKEGNNVKFYIKTESEKDIGDGFVEKTNDWKAEINWADLIVFDDVLGFGAEAEKLRKKGKLVIGGTSYTDKLEDDRTFGQEELKKMGVAIMPYKEFKDFQTAINYVKKNPGKYVIKPSGEAQESKELLYVGNDEKGEDVISVLEHYKAHIKHIEVFHLQKKAEGVETAIGGFFNGKEFAQPININFEHKKLFPGTLGPNTGEMGTSMIWEHSGILFKRTLKKMESKLAKEKFTGYIDLNCIIEKDNIYPLEFTSRFGYPTISIQQEGIQTKISDLFFGIALGTMKKFDIKNNYQIGIRAVLPPFPWVESDDEIFEIKSKNARIYFDTADKEGIHIEKVKIINGEWHIAGSYGMGIIVCASADSMEKAIKKAYARIKNVHITDMYYRNDIGTRWKEDRKKLASWGYLKERTS
jgi:phosphoribosylamine--glycine ligase